MSRRQKISATLFTCTILVGLAFLYQNCSQGLKVSSNNATSSLAAGNPSPGPAPAPSPGSSSGGGSNSTFHVTQHHKQSMRSGFYVDPLFTKTAAANLHLDSNFSSSVTGNVYAQPLFYDAQGVGPDLVIVATEENHVTALNAATGAKVWDKSFGATATVSQHGCGNIDPLGITGTPVLDPVNGIIYFDAMVSGASLKHMIYAINLSDGVTRSGWPIDVSKTVSGFNSTTQNQRGALLLQNGYLYVPYGGHWGDCGSYYGWVMAVPVGNPSGILGWHTKDAMGGIWGPSGVAGDGTSVFAATGNTGGSSTWGQGEAILKFSTPINFSGATADYYSPTNWLDLDNTDKDLGGSAVLLFDFAAGASPQHMALSLGKDGFARLLNRDNLGGVSNALTSICITQCIPQVALGNTPELITATTSYVVGGTTYASFSSPQTTICPSGQSGELTTIAMKPGSPPTMSAAWCAQQNGNGSPMTTATDSSGSNAIVWGLGAEGDNSLHGFDAVTGAKIVTASVGATVQHFQTPIAAKGRIYVGANGKIVAFAL